MLVDPRTSVKARTGILPAKTLALPNQDIAAVLASHELFFQVAPTLRSAEQLTIPHPSRKYGTWSWLSPTLAGSSNGGSSEAVWAETVAFGQKSGNDGLPVYPLMLQDGSMRLRVPAASGAAIISFSVVFEASATRPLALVQVARTRS